jgi:hypothetical protein
MFAAYLDESNSNLQGKVCAVAGFLGTENQWPPFIEDWIKTLGHRKTLHMKDLRWKDRDRVLLARLGVLPERHAYMLAVQICVAQIMNYVPANEPVAPDMIRFYVNTCIAGGTRVEKSTAAGS